MPQRPRTTRRAFRTTTGGAGTGGRSRFTVVRILLVLVLAAAGLKLVYIQGFAAEKLAGYAEQQRTKVIPISSPRGAITDRDGRKLAFSVEKRALMVSLQAMHKSWREYTAKHPKSSESFETRVTEIAAHIAKRLPEKTSKVELLRKFHKDEPFTYLVEGVEPSVAEKITAKYPEIGTERRAKRVYPADRLAAGILGFANWRMQSPDVSKHSIHGLMGLESTLDDVLSGTPGKRLVGTAQGSEVVIPGTERIIKAAKPGSDVALTIDSDVQYVVQRMLADYVAKTHADGGSAVVMDVKTGEVHALANAKTFNPNKPSTFTPERTNNGAVTTPFEPGSVAKLITAAGVIEHDVTKPQELHQVPDHIEIADRTISDAWQHTTLPFTTTGIFGKSSNVGTLMLSQQLGPQRWMDLARKFGLGLPTGIALPGESAGYLPPREQWSGSTFANLPIGQGVSMTLLQMTGMYQAIANDGVRIEPRIVRSKTKPDGTKVPGPAPDKVRVVSEQTADTVLGMLRATVQDGEHRDDGTGKAAAIAGYQIAGKTGTGQQIDPDTGAYSDTLYNITFAGVVPANDPRYVVGIRLDAPDTTLPKGHSAAPLFHDIAAYVAQHYQIPLSDKPAPYQQLIKL